MEINKVGKLYFVTVLDIDLNSRCVGYYYNYSDAECSVFNNDCDIFEYTYLYTIIEHPTDDECGLYPLLWEREFYEFDFEEEKYFKIDDPEWSKETCNYALG